MDTQFNIWYLPSEFNYVSQLFIITLITVPKGERFAPSSGLKEKKVKRTIYLNEPLATVVPYSLKNKLCLYAYYIL